MDGYSRTIAILKVLLPLSALGILSTLFLLARNITPTAEIPFAEGEVATRVADQQITSPYFSGVTSAGDEILVSAQTTSLGSEDNPAKAIGLKARIDSKDGVQFNLTSDTGTMALDKDILTFEGNVRIVSSDGYVLTTQTLNASMTEVAGSTPGPVEGTGPLGRLNAGKMELSAQFEGGPLYLLFKNGVKLVYEPERSE